MKTGLRLMFAKRFWPAWASVFVGLSVPLTISYLSNKEWDREAYAMRGRSNMFKQDYMKLKQQDPTRELWT